MELEGKRIAFLGDSITEGHGAENIANRYDNRMARDCRLEAVYNYGIGGTRLAYQRVPSEEARFDLCFCGRAFDLEPQADIIVVYGGVNDYGHGDAPIGDWGDKTPATFYGAVDYLMRLLKERYPKAQVVFMTPARCCFIYWGEDYRKPSTDPCKQPGAQPLQFYVDVIVRTAEKYGIPVLNLYEKLPVDPEKPEEKEAYTSDGLHLNDAGHGLLAELLANFIKSL